MTIDRYIYVVHPFENIKWRKPNNVFLLSLIIWLREYKINLIHQLFMIIYFSVSCTLASPFYYHYGVTNDMYKQCVLLTDDNLQKHFRIYTVTLYYFIPLTIILICYTKLLYYVFSKENKLKPKTVEKFIYFDNQIVCFCILGI